MGWDARGGSDLEVEAMLSIGAAQAVEMNLPFAAAVSQVESIFGGV